MTGGLDLIDQGRRLLWMTGQTRLRLIESELALGLTFCIVVENDLYMGELDAAQRFKGKLEHLIALLRRSVNATAGLPGEQMEELQSRLAKLERRVSAVESRLKRRAAVKPLQLLSRPERSREEMSS